MDTTLSDPMVGRLLEGRYAVEAFIAHGGMASVYLATDTRLERRVAVKVMHAHLSDDPETVARFEREARAAARLSSPDVVAVYDQGNDNGRAFLVMEFVPGATLRHILRDRGRLTPGEALAVMDHVLAALAAAHNAGLVHRDVKPENVLVTADGRVKVADFGLARAVAGSTVTTTGSVLLGTAAYLAPEQFEHGTADARSDVYSAGVLLFELLTGTTPFQADSAYALLNRHANEDIPAPSTRAAGIPPQIDALVTWATSRDPRQRPEDAGELHGSLIDVRDRLGVHGSVPSLPTTLTTKLVEPAGARPIDLTQVVNNGRPPVPPKRVKARRPRRRKRGLIVSAIVAIIVLLAGLGGWWFAAGRYTQAPNVVRLSKTAADAKLKTAGLHAHWLPSVHSLTTGAGLVISESPTGRVTHGTTVDLTLSLGAAKHALPPVSGLSVTQAKAALSSLHVSVAHQVTVFSTTVGKGLAVATQPGAGKVVKEGSSVTLEVSKGQQHVTVPPVNGETLAQATQDLEAAEFTVNAPIERFNPAPAGTVITSTPKEGSTPIKGSDVTLVVSKGPKLFPVPDVKGDSIAAAEQAITTAGFVPDPQQFASGGLGIVYSYSPSGTAPHGTTIVLKYF
jgi:serine/threonine protein kinase/beta-lactam-binding protein with PASTA domain